MRFNLNNKYLQRFIKFSPRKNIKGTKVLELEINPKSLTFGVGIKSLLFY